MRTASASKERREAILNEIDHLRWRSPSPISRQNRQREGGDDAERRRVAVVRGGALGPIWPARHWRRRTICRASRCCESTRRATSRRSKPSRQTPRNGSLSPLHTIRQCGCGHCQMGSCSAQSGCPAGTATWAWPIAVALSPDGATIAIGGWMENLVGDENIYLFDRASGTLAQRLPGIPKPMSRLGFFSRWQTSCRRALQARTAFASSTPRTHIDPFQATASTVTPPTRVDFDREGRLVSASLDGFVRLYALDHFDKPAVPKTTGERRRPTIFRRFSPDGRHIAVGDAIARRSLS